jgi:FkbH-like protein
MVLPNAPAQNEVLAAIKRCLRPREKLLVLHSSLPNLGPPSSDLKWAVLGAVRALTDSGITIAIPAFTFSFCKGTPYHHRSPSETGVVADWLLGLVGARRTPHPIYSFATLGPLAPRIADCVNTTTFGPDSCFALFEELDASILMLGSEWLYCTQFHRYEEEAQVAYRTYKDFIGVADFGSGPGEVTTRMYVRDLEVDAENDWLHLESELRTEGAIRSAQLWKGRIEAATCRDIARVARRQLAADPFAVVRDAPHVEYICGLVKSRASKPPLKIALLGSSNLEILKSHLVAVAAELIRDQAFVIYMPSFGQMLLEIADPASGLNRFDADFTLFCDRLEDLAGVASLDLCHHDAVVDKVRQYAEAIATYRAKSRGWLFIHRFAPTWQSLAGRSADDMIALSAASNSVLASSLEGANNIHFIDIVTAGHATAGGHQDPRLWFLGRFPFSDEFSLGLARQYCGLILAATGRTARLVALDLDNTLWGGVLGEEGLAGIAIGGDYPGNAYAAFQRGLKLLSQRGIALALLSKNDEDLAYAALTELPAMELGKDDFVACRIDWSPKWRNIRALSDELSLGLENVLFVDDNPVEREQMRRNQPAVKVHELPTDPSLYLQSLLDSPWLTSLSVTAEDRRRVASFRQRASLLEAKSKHGADIEEFYASLGTTLYMQPYDQANSARALQLLQKTNQFNTTTRRYGRAEIEGLLAAGDEVYVVGLRDRYSEFENVGLVVCRWNRPWHGWGLIDSYLLSCRVLGRGIETGVPKWIVTRARQKGMQGVVGEIVITPRNTPARSVFADSGFKADKECADQWLFDLREQSETLPPWLTIVNGTPERGTGGKDAI